jgi:hypothetical protein
MTVYPELIRYPYLNRISSDNGILGNWLSRAVTKSRIPIRRLHGTWDSNILISGQPSNISATMEKGLH